MDSFDDNKTVITKNSANKGLGFCRGTLAFLKNLKVERLIREELKSILRVLDACEKEVKEISEIISNIKENVKKEISKIDDNEAAKKSNKDS